MSQSADTSLTGAGATPWDTSEPDQPITRLVESLLEKYDPDQRLHLSGSPFAELPGHVREAVLASASERGYAPSRGDPRLREAIAASLAPRGIHVSPGQVLVTDGAMHALDLVFRSVLGPGDEVLMPAPGFFIDGLVRRAGGRLVHFPSPATGRFRPSWAAARALVTSRTRVLYVNTPVNPTGYVYDESDVSAATELAGEAGLLLVSDESLSHFVYGGRRHLSPAAGAPRRPGGVLVGSFSKDYAMPGMRVGYVVLPANLVRQVSAMLEWSVLSVSRSAQAAALAALAGPHDWVEAMVADAAGRGRRVASELNAIARLSCIPPSGGLNLFPGFAGDAERLTHDLVVRFGVPVCPGSAFGGPGYFRVQFGGAEQDLGLAVQRIRDAAV
ncbi:MAG: pyridoxal phosphate-dependent aminotransferase [Streptosporangiaceae bacterium]